LDYIKSKGGIKTFQVWRNSPYGDIFMGTFLNEESAKKVMNDWNKDHSGWDLAEISETLVKYE
jgi:hypothetical protein